MGRPSSGNITMIVESPNKATTIRSFLRNLKDNIRVVATVGHIVELVPGGEAVQIDNSKVTMRYRPVSSKSPKTGKVSEKLPFLQEQLHGAAGQTVVLATDGDREGEFIAQSVEEWALQDVQPAILSRAVFHEVTPEGIRKALETARPGGADRNLVQAQKARRCIDYILGHRVSDVMRHYLSGKRDLGTGRVQGPSLRLLVERELRILEHVPQTYFNLQLHLKDLPTVATLVLTPAITGLPADTKSPLVTDRRRLDAIAAAVQGMQVRVVDIAAKAGKIFPPPAFMTSTLLMEASRVYKMSSELASNISQLLFEGVGVHEVGGLITYHRTDREQMSDESLQFGEKLVRSICPDIYLGYRNEKAKAGAQGAHEAIRPTSCLTPDELEAKITGRTFRDIPASELVKLYRLIWHRFVAAFCNPIEKQTQTVLFDDGKGHAYTAEGVRILSPGWASVYPWSNAEEKKIDPFSVNELVRVEKAHVKSDHTKPPSRYSDGMLIQSLEKRGIGRPSTYRNLISALLRHEFVDELKTKEDRGRLQPTQVGITVLRFLQDHFAMFIADDYTKNMEERLDRVEAGKEDWQKIVVDFRDQLESTVGQLKGRNVQVVVLAPGPEEIGEPCAACGHGPVVQATGPFGHYLRCEACSKKTGGTFLKNVRCPKCQSGVVSRKIRSGSTIRACVKCEWVEFPKRGAGKSSSPARVGTRTARKLPAGAPQDV